MSEHEQYTKIDVKMGVQINRALIAKDGDKLIQAVTDYMLEFGLIASANLITKIPTSPGR